MSTLDEQRELWWPSATTELARVVQLEPEHPFATVHGEQLERIQVSYESWGRLNDSRDNVVLVVHPLSLDCHVTGDFDGQPPGWWEALFGPGRVIDTDRYFVVCPNLIGGCYGTTGPRFAAPDGEPYLERYPLLTPRDMMRVQRLFLRELGVRRTHMVIGPSMGGMVAWEWAIEAGDEVNRVVVVAAPLRTTAKQIALNWLQRRAVELDLLDDEQAGKAGQMIARGVGMVSYRAEVGLDEKFGRDWFKQPGGTLKQRGMFNVESWLRHHGKRSVKRFDPYTYLLYTRAMDLHDVGHDRGSMVSALDRVRCDVLVVGISSDELYSPSEVHLGADMLGHLGRSVAYEEIRSPHGHDGFLLETNQLSAMLAAPATRRAGVVATTTDRPVRTARLGILGAGRVARSLLRLFDERGDVLRADHGLRFEVAAVAEIDTSKVLDPVFDSLEVTRKPVELVERGDLDVIVDLTRGPGSRNLVEQALRGGRNVVTPNKGLIRVHGPELERLALDHGVRLAYHNSIATGWPLLFSVERSLARSRTKRIQALLSATCNVILERVEEGATPGQAVAAAQQMGITEPDPELDTSGWDTAQKLGMLIARTHGLRFPVSEMAVQGITDIDPQLVREAPELGYRVRLVAQFLAGRNRATLGVQPLAVDAEGHLGSLRGNNTVVLLEGTDTGELVYVGKIEGDVPVASAVLGDLVGIFNPERSWTGRFPSAPYAAGAPRFSRYLVRRREEFAEITDTPSPGAIPLLDSLIHRRE